MIFVFLLHNNGNDFPMLSNKLAILNSHTIKQCFEIKELIKVQKCHACQMAVKGLSVQMLNVKFEHGTYRHD